MSGFNLFGTLSYTPVDGAGQPYALAQAYVYQAGTTTPTTVYHDSALTVPHANPIIADANGLFPVAWASTLSPTAYRVVIKTAGFVQLQDVDDIPPFPDSLTQAYIGGLLYPQSDAEIAAGVVPTAPYPELDVRRYGAIGDGSANDQTAFTSAAAVAAVAGAAYFVPATTAFYALVAAPTGSWYGPGQIKVGGIPISSLGLHSVYVNVLDYPGADLGAKIQAAYNARAKLVSLGGAGIGNFGGIGIVIPDNPTGGSYSWATPVDLANATGDPNALSWVSIVGVSSPNCVAGAACVAAGYMLRVGLTRKVDYFRLENISFDPGNTSLECAIYMADGTAPIVRNISFHRSSAAQFTYGIRQVPAGLGGVSFGIFESLRDSGGSAVSTAIITAQSIVSSKISNIRPGPNCAYGVQLNCAVAACAGNEISNIVSEFGAATTTALVQLWDGGSWGIQFNHIHSLCGSNTADYGVEVANGGSNVNNNQIDVPNYDFTSGALHNIAGPDSVYANLVQSLRGNDSWTPGTIGAGSDAVKTVTVTGAELGDFSQASYDQILATGMILTSQAQAGAVVVQMTNTTGGNVTPTSGNVYVKVQKRASLLT
jgi:hypothetical protein